MSGRGSDFAGLPQSILRYANRGAARAGVPIAAAECILAVDEAAEVLQAIQGELGARGYHVFTAPCVADALRILEQTAVELVITDISQASGTGLDLVRHVRENHPDIEVIATTASPTIRGAVEAVRTGAEDYLAKPFTDDELCAAVEHAFSKLRLRRAVRPPAYSTAAGPAGLIGDSAAMRRVFGAIAKAAPTSATVLITGESGTGKELVARAIHYSSPRASAPFVPVNCAAIPETLIESELFGYVKGAFTGAAETRAGFFQTADGGTIFLDEVSATSPSMQSRLLRVLQERAVCMLGSARVRPVDVRVVAATNKQLRVLVDKDLFREDLYFRLNVLTIDVPPLRERGDDVLLLIRHFTGVFASELGRAAPSFSDAALEVLRRYRWPGNVRELENVVQRLVVMADGDRIDVPELPSLMRFSAGRPGLERTLAEVEAEHIRNVLAGVNGNRTRAAEILGIDRKTLRERLKG